MTESEVSRTDLVYRAKLAEQAERYDDMVEFMDQIVNTPVELSTEERNLLSVAYKNVIGARRASWRIISSIELKNKQIAGSEDAERKFQMAATYRGKVEEELKQICNKILSALTDKLIKTSTSSESQVFYYKMKGDYHRYMAEFLPDSETEKKTDSEASERVKASEASLEAYTNAQEVAEKNLEPTNPIRLGLALNFSVFYYEILKKPDKACSLAKEAFDKAISDLDHLDENSYKDSTLIMQLLRDNLTLWTAGADIDDKDDDDDDLQQEAN